MPDKITEHYDELLDFTGIDHLKRRMDSEILEKYRELLREDIKNGYTQVKDRVGTLMEQRAAARRKSSRWQASDIEEIRRKEAENEKKLREAENEQKELDELYKTIKKSTSQQKSRLPRLFAHWEADDDGFYRHAVPDDDTYAARLADKIAEGDVYASKEEGDTAGRGGASALAAEFTDYVQKQAEATEQQAAQLRTFAEQLTALSRNELVRYHISAAPFVHQVELLSMQIPGTIASEVSRRMTDSDAAYQKLCRMMPGAEKEKATQEFMREIIGQGVEKCSRLAQSVLDQLEEDLTAALQEKAGAVAAAARAHAAGTVRACRSGRGRQQQEKLKAQAELLYAACDLTEELFDREEG